MGTTSHHFLIEIKKCKFELLNDKNFIENNLIKAVTEGGATYINHFFHQFSPQGVSGVVVIAESHLSIHTWPEEGYAALDVFTCGDKNIGESVTSNLIKAFDPGEYEVKYIERG
jgi:S-adenosylmethionine decarboxylase proenzyme